MITRLRNWWRRRQQSLHVTRLARLMSGAMR